LADVLGDDLLEDGLPEDGLLTGGCDSSGGRAMTCAGSTRVPDRGRATSASTASSRCSGGDVGGDGVFFRERAINSTQP
jgi:hypothetical protein